LLVSNTYYRRIKSLTALLLVSVMVSSLLLVNFTTTPVAQASSANPQPYLSIGDTNWLTVNSLSSGNTLKDADCPSIKFCYVVGDSGTILSSYDFGVTWHSIPNVTTDDFSVLGCPSALICYAVTEKGQIYKFMSLGGKPTANYWFLQDTIQQAGAVINDLHCFDNSNCIAVGEKGLVLHTTNGKDWTENTLTFNGLPIETLTGVKCATLTLCYTVGKNNVVLKSVNGGVNWTSQTTNVATNNNWAAVECASTTTCYAVSSYSHVIVNTPNATANWTLRASLNTSIAKIACPASDICYIGTIGGISYKNSNSQMSAWTKQSVNLDIHTMAISCPNTTSCMLVTWGRIATTTDSGTSWIKRTTDRDETIRDIACTSQTLCYAAATDGTIYKTGTSGLNWVTLDTPLGEGDDLNSISCPGLLTCYAVGDNGNSIVTTDGGKTWTKLNTGTGLELSGIYCGAVNDCLAVGDTDIILELNSASQWVVRNPGGNKSEIYSVSCATATLCYAVGYKKIWKSTNGGTTWQSQLTNAIYPFRDITCPSASVCYIASSQGLVRYTTSTDTWEQKGPAGTDFTDLQCSSATTCHLVTAYRQVYTTDNSGVNWTSESAGTINYSGSHQIVCPGQICLVAGHRGAVVVSAIPVTSNMDDQSGEFAGTLSYALAHVTANQKHRIRIQVITNRVELTGTDALPLLKPTTTLQGNCQGGVPQVTIKAPANTSMVGLILEGNNTVNGLKLEGFINPAIVYTQYSNNNTVTCVKTVS
jgi:photosystem II stability/assembly factor-like uncharacterized protein